MEYENKIVLQCWQTMILLRNSSRDIWNDISYRLWTNYLDSCLSLKIKSTNWLDLDTITLFQHLLPKHEKGWGSFFFFFYKMVTNIRRLLCVFLIWLFCVFFLVFLCVWTKNSWFWATWFAQIVPSFLPASANWLQRQLWLHQINKKGFYTKRE